MDIHIGDWVKVLLASANTPIIGIVAYSGETSFADGLWLGLTLVNECRKFAKNNGTVNGIHYFDDDDDNGDSVQNTGAGNFGIFVRPNKVELLEIDTLLSYQHISIDTKLKLFKSKLTLLKNTVSDLSSKLEMVQVEYDYLITDREALINQLDELKFNSNNQSSPNRIDLTESFKIKEQKYLETISSLRLDLKNLESKLLSHNLNNKLILDLQQSELIIDRLTLENDQLSSTINSLNDKISINNDLITCYEQTETELNTLVNDLHIKLKASNDELLNNRKNLEKANEIISNFTCNKNDNTAAHSSLYNVLLHSLFTSFDNFSNFLSFNYDNSSIKYFKSIFQLKEFSKIIIPHNEEWKSLFLKLEFIENLLPYDTHNSLYLYQKPIDKLINLMMNYIEFDNESFISLSTDLDIEPLSKFEFYFEFSLFNREYEIYNKSLNNEDTSELLKLRTNNKGWENNTSKNLIKLPTWNKILEEEEIPDNDEEIKQLKLKIKILESKLINDKKIQHDYIKFENDLKNLNDLNAQLISDLKHSQHNELNLSNKIDELNQKLSKFNICDDDDIMDEFKILEINKLLNTISKQRKTILNFSTNTQPSNDYSILDFAQPKKFNPTIPISISGRIDKLFELNNTVYDDNIKYQKLLEYINLY